MENKIISIDITPDNNTECTDNAGVMWEHNATVLKFNIAQAFVGDYRYYIEYRSLMGTRVRTEYLELNTKDNTVTYSIPVTMTSLKGVECYFNIVSIDEDGNTVQVVKPKKFGLTFDYSPDTDNSLCKVNDFSINTLLEAIRLGTFKGDKGEKGDKGDKGEKGDTGGISEEYAAKNFANAYKGCLKGRVVTADDVSPMLHQMDVSIKSKNIFDGQWVAGGLNTSDGAEVVSSSNIRTAFIPIKPNTPYYASLNADATYFFMAYDAEFNFVAYKGMKKGSFAFISGAQEHYIRIMQYNNTEAPLNVQIEEGAEATEYTPYVDLSTVMLTRCGKNLWNKGDVTVEGKYLVSKLDCTLKAGGTYTISADVTSTDTDALTCLVLAYPSNQQLGLLERKQGSALTFTLNQSTSNIVLYSSDSSVNGDGDRATFTNVQLELGDTATDYEEYKGESYASNAEGILTVEAVSPVITLLTNTEGTVLECEYNKDTNKIIKKLINAVISLGGTV